MPKVIAMMIDNDVNALFKRLRLHFPLTRMGYEKSEWRLTQPEVGMSEGLPETHGVLRATDGSSCVIEKEDGGVVVGHITNWVCDVEDNERSECVGASNIRRRVSKRDSEIDLLASELLAGLV